MSHYTQIDEVEFHDFLRPPVCRPPDLWAWQGELVAIWLIKVDGVESGFAVKLYTTIKRGERVRYCDRQTREIHHAVLPGTSAPAGDDAIRVCVVDCGSGLSGERTDLSSAEGVSSFPIVRRTKNWRVAVRERLQAAMEQAETFAERRAEIKIARQQIHGRRGNVSTAAG